MKQEFNSVVVNMIIIYIEKINSFRELYKYEPNFIHKMINLIKRFLMNEIEVACFTLLIDIIGYTYKDKKNWLYYSILCILSKKLCGKDNDIFLIVNILSRNNNKFIDEYSSFINDFGIIEKINKQKINLKEINKRFILLSKPINTYCTKNYINLHGIIDKIIKTSQSYFKENSINHKNKLTHHRIAMNY